MIRYLKRASSDILSNAFLNLITILTIAFSVLILGSFILFFENAESLIDSWNQDGRIMVYLDENFDPEKDMIDLKNSLIKLKQTRHVDFLPKTRALEKLKKDMNSHTALFEGLKENPLPDAFLITLKSDDGKPGIEEFALMVSSMPFVEEVEYGEAWLDRFKEILKVFRTTGYLMIFMFFAITFFITSNTVRLSLYSRLEEVEIMRLVGATDSFIAVPFYIQGLIQGICGSVAGLGLLFILYISASPCIVGENSFMMFNIRFISLKYLLLIFCCSSCLGWFGCYVSLRRFLKY